MIFIYLLSNINIIKILAEVVVIYKYNIKNIILPEKFYLSILLKKKHTEKNFFR